MAKRKGSMTDRERVEAMLQHKKPDRVPIWPFAGEAFAAVNAGYSIADAYNNPGKALEAQRRCCKQYGWVFSPFFMYASYGGWEFGGDIKWPSSQFDQAPSITRYPVETEEDVWKLNKPDVARAGFHPLLAEFNRLASREKLDNEPFNVCAVAGGAFSLAGNICGPDKLNRWLIKKPDVVHYLLQLVVDFVMDLVRYWKDMFGVENALVMTGEVLASNQMISPRHFEQFVLPYLKQSYEGLRSLGYKHIYSHICGEQNANLPFWSLLPMGDPGIISIGHEVDILTAAKYFPDDIIYGNLEPAIIQTGTPKEVYEASREVIEKGKMCPGGFIFSTGCQLPPLSPPENVRMMTQAVNDFGWYK